MENKIAEELKNYPKLLKYLTGISKDIWDLLLPENIEDYQEFADDIESCRATEEIRNHIMKVQNRFNLPLRPNSSVKETIQLVRVETIKKKKSQFEDTPPEDDYDSSMW